MPYFKGPFGLNPQKTHQGAGHTGVVETYAIHPLDQNAYFRGTPVKLAGRTNPHGIPYVVIAEPGDPLIGPVTEWEYIPTRDGHNYVQGGPALVKVVVDPNMRYHVMVDASLDIHDYKCHANLTCETGDKCYGLSCVEIDVATVGPEPDKQVRIHRTVQAPWAELDDFCKANGKRIVEVSINSHQNIAGYADCPSDLWDDECVGPDLKPSGDVDGDGIPNSEDDEPFSPAPDTDGDGVPDPIDPEPDNPDITGIDADGDGEDAGTDPDDNDPDVTSETGGDGSGKKEAE